MPEPTTLSYLVVAALVFVIGAVGVMVRRNPLIMFMCIELMLNAVNLSFVALARELTDIDGQSIVFFVLVAPPPRSWLALASSWRSCAIAHHSPPMILRN